MRGKLRDKRAAARRDIFKRESPERKRPGKRDPRTMIALSQQIEEEDYEEDVDDEKMQAEVPQKK